MLVIVLLAKEMLVLVDKPVIQYGVEEALAAHEAVLEVGVAGVPDETKGEAVRAWVVLRSGYSATEADLRAQTAGESALAARWYGRRGALDLVAGVGHLEDDHGGAVTRRLDLDGGRLLRADLAVVRDERHRERVRLLEGDEKWPIKPPTLVAVEPAATQPSRSKEEPSNSQ